jgi:hypothetical protein
VSPGGFLVESWKPLGDPCGIFAVILGYLRGGVKASETFSPTLGPRGTHVNTQEYNLGSPPPGAV